MKLEELNLHDSDMRELLIKNDKTAILSCYHWAGNRKLEDTEYQQLFSPIVITFHQVYNLEFWIPIPEKEKVYKTLTLEEVDTENSEFNFKNWSKYGISTIRELVGPAVKDVKFTQFYDFIKNSQEKSLIPMGISSSEIDKEDDAFVVYFHSQAGFALKYQNYSITTDTTATKIGKGVITFPSKQK